MRMFSWYIALRFFLGEWKRTLRAPATLIALLGISFGVGSFILAVSVVGGFQDVYQKSILGFNAHIVLSGPDLGEEKVQNQLKTAFDALSVSQDEISLWQKNKWLSAIYTNSEMRTLGKKGIVGYSPFRFVEALVVTKDGLKSVVVKGIENKNVNQVYLLKIKKLDDDSSLASMKGGLIGSKLFELYGGDKLSAGKEIKIIVPEDEETKSSNYKKWVKKLRVDGLFESGLYEFDSRFILVSMKTLNELAPSVVQQEGIEIKLDDPTKVEAVANHLDKLLGGQFDLVTWKDLNEPLFEAMHLEKLMFIIIMGLLIVVSSFNICSTLFILGSNQKNQLRTLHVMGLSKRGVKAVLSAQGHYLGIIGYLLGLVFSGALMWSLKTFNWFKLDAKIYFIDELPVQFSWVMAFFVLVFIMMVIGLITRLMAKYVLSDI